MQDLKVVLIQADQRWENKEENYSHYSDLFQSINEPVDLLVLPEMFDTGFTMNTSLAENWGSGKGEQFLRQEAHRLQCAIYTSMMVLENGHFYNRGIFMYPDGAIKTYDKRKAFCLGGEDKHFSSGTSETIVEYKGWKINLQICYDLRFPEIVRNRIQSNGSAAYDVIAYVANWPERRSLHWKTLLQARAIENQCYVLGVNRVGTDGNGLIYSGDSSLTDALGQKQECVPGKEMVLQVNLNKKELDDLREVLPFLKDR